MQVLEGVVQGSDAWHLFRIQHNGASEAAAMLGLSLTTKRSELLHMKHTGIAKEFSDWVQSRILDKGHEVEALARPRVEVLIGADLYPVTCYEGSLSASCDGLTMAGDIAMEHKQWSASLAERMRAGEFPEEHMPQCQQVLMVTKAEKLIFVVSDGTRENMLFMWVYPDPSWFERIRAGWDQFDKDLAAYVPPEVVDPAPAGKAPETLPALRVEVTGMVTASNLEAFKQTALTAIRSVNRQLTTDADFANADAAVKWCSEVEARLAATKDHALSQTASIDELFRTMDAISAEARQVRLDLTKLVTARKESIRGEIVAGGTAALTKHIAALNAEIAPMSLRPVPADFGGAIKNKRTVASLQDAVDTTLANAKIVANGQAQAIRANLAVFKDKAAGQEALFADLGQLVHKAADDFTLVVTSRIAEHKAKEAEKEVKRQAEADRVAAEKLMAEAYEAAKTRAGPDAPYEVYNRFGGSYGKQVPMDKVSEYIAALNALPPKKTEPQDSQQALKAEPATADASALETPAITIPVSVPPAVAALVRRMEPAAAPAPDPDEQATLKLGDINARLAPINVTAVGLAELGIHHSATHQSAKLYRPSDFGRIVAAMHAHLVKVLDTVGV